MGIQDVLVPSPHIYFGIVMEIENSPFYVFNTHAEAEQAIQWLRRANFDIKKLSLIGKGYHSEEHSIGFYATADHITSWGGVGAFWGGIWALLLAPAVFLLPDIGLIAVAGPIVTDLIAALEGPVMGGASALSAALRQVGASEEQASKYENALKADKYILMVHGNAEEMALARAVMATRALWIAEPKL